MKLTEYERQSPLWQKMEKYITERIDVCRKKNDGDLDQFKTASLRGEIRAWKKILLIGESQPAIETNGTED